MLVNRIAEHVDPILRRNQNGFRRGRSTTPAITFVDFAKAVVIVNRNIMLHILSSYSIPHEIVQAIAVKYHAPNSCFSTSDGPTEPFFTTTGIVPDDTLAPYLFVIVVDYILP